MKHIAKIAALVVACLSLPQDAAAQVRLEMAGKLALARNAALHPAQKAELAAFRRSKDYYGAFYVSPRTGVSHGHAGASSLAAAKAIARMGCERQSRGPCTLHAVITPKTTNIGPDGRIDLSGTVANVMEVRFRSLQRGRWSAFAMTPEGAWGAASNVARERQAEAQAMRQCRAAAAKARGDYPVAMSRVMAARGMFGCSPVLTLQK